MHFANRETVDVKQSSRPLNSWLTSEPHTEGGLVQWRRDFEAYVDGSTDAAERRAAMCRRAILMVPKAAVACDWHLIADLETPSFISRRVTQRHLDRRYS